MAKPPKDETTSETTVSAPPAQPAVALSAPPAAPPVPLSPPKIHDAPKIATKAVAAPDRYEVEEDCSVSAPVFAGGGGVVLIKGQIVAKPHHPVDHFIACGAKLRLLK